MVSTRATATGPPTGAPAAPAMTASAPIAPAATAPTAIASAATASTAGTLPAAWYADPAHHALELTAIFREGWSCVGVVDDLPATHGYLATATADGTPVVVTTDADGRRRAFLNVCRHRGAPVADGCGQARALSCPYHAWVYR